MLLYLNDQDANALKRYLSDKIIDNASYMEFYDNSQPNPVKRGFIIRPKSRTDAKSDFLFEPVYDNSIYSWATKVSYRTIEKNGKYTAYKTTVSQYFRDTELLDRCLTRMVTLHAGKSGPELKDAYEKMLMAVHQFRAEKTRTI